MKNEERTRGFKDSNRSSSITHLSSMAMLPEEVVPLMVRRIMRKWRMR